MTLLSTMGGYNEKMAKKEEGPHQEPNLTTPWSWPSQLPELWEIHFCSLSHPVYGISAIAAQAD